MIEARPHRLIKAFLGWHVERRLRRTFAELRVYGLEAWRAELAAGSCIVVANHTSWWDAMLYIYVSTRLLPHHAYGLMEADNLRRYPFFGRVGGFGIERGQGRDAQRALAYAGGLLQASKCAVWIFPQGRERPITERPLGFRPGAAQLAVLAGGVRVLPVALRYEFGEAEAPVCYVSCGAALTASGDRSETRASQEDAVDAELQRIESEVRAPGSQPGFTTMWQRSPSRLGHVAERCLSWVTRYR